MKLLELSEMEITMFFLCQQFNRVGAQQLCNNAINSLQQACDAFFCGLLRGHKQTRN